MRLRQGLILALLLAASAAAVRAGDGIPIGNAVFYPSVEAVYTHTDNLYLQDSSMPYGNVSDSFWEIRPTLGFEFPFQQSYLKLDLGYQYKDYRHYQLSSHNTYTGDLTGLFALGPQLKLRVEDQFIRGVQEVNKFDPGYETYYSNTPFNSNNLRVGLEMPMGKLNSVEVYGLYNNTHFSQSYNPLGTPPPFYGYEQTGGGVTFRHYYTPESAWLVDAQYLASRPKNQAFIPGTTQVLDRRNDDWKVALGWQGAITRQVTGHARAGWERMKFPDNGQGNYSGFTMNAGLAFLPSEYFRVNLDLDREAYQSAFDVNNFYTATGGELQVHQEVTRHLFWTAGFRYQENSYPSATAADFGFTTTPLDPYAFLNAGQFRKDKIGRAFGEVGFHFTKLLSLRANYQYENRDSNIRYADLEGVHKPFSYKENRLMAQVQLAW